ncbi:hypothetical protein Nmel_012955 [Mimus melanotis]
MAIAPCPVPVPTEQSLAPSSGTHWRYWYGLMRSPRSFPFSRLTKPSSHSLSSSEMLQTPHHLHGLCWALSSSSLAFLSSRNPELGTALQKGEGNTS